MCDGLIIAPYQKCGEYLSVAFESDQAPLYERIAKLCIAIILAIPLINTIALLAINYFTPMVESASTSSAIGEGFTPIQEIERFYKSQRTILHDGQQKTFQEVLDMSDVDWEKCGHVQWLFPGNWRSLHRSTAPEFADSDVTSLQENGNMRVQMLQAFDRALQFYGFTWATHVDNFEIVRNEPQQIIQADNFSERWRNMQQHPHNYCRITRILKSLELAGLHAEAQTFLEALLAANGPRRDKVPGETLRFWQDAVPSRSSL